MNTQSSIRTILNHCAHGLWTGFSRSLLLCLILAPLARAQSQRQWGGETLTPLGGAEYQSAKFGRVSIQGNAATSNLGWVPGMGSFLDARGNGVWNSPEYGEVRRANGNAGWVTSSRFGWTHFGSNAQTYGGWTWTERFQWMKFERPGNAVYLWVPMMRSWMAVNPDGSFHSFEWRHLTPQGLTRYHSSVFGGLTTGNFGGWVHSDRFGWMWANGDGTWFWSDGRKEWLGVTAGGGIWSTAQRRFLGVAPEGMVLVEGGRLHTDNALNGTAVSDFLIGRYEVTRGEWNRVRAWALNNGYDIGEAGPKNCGDHYPIYQVSWYNAVKWCNAKSEMDGLTPVYSANGVIYRRGQFGWESDKVQKNTRADGYRLPREAEWEYAARGGRKSRGYIYAGSNNLDEVAWYDTPAVTVGNDAPCKIWVGWGIAPVGQKAPNELGLYDMSGNVSEWCWDMGNWLESSPQSRWMRGGGFLDNYILCRVGNRLGTSMFPDQSPMTSGFRLARNAY